DPETDHVFLASWDGLSRPRSLRRGPDDPPPVMVNGDSLPRTMTLRAGTAHRFRFINIGPAARQRFSILRDTTVQTWRALAKDGADLPAAQATERSAVQWVAVGEIYDFEFLPLLPGEYALVRGPDDRKPVLVRRLIVR
ncbi:MAG: hypothetical protein ACRDHK_14085, partial [Actinomycetota bacterium]